MSSFLAFLVRLHRSGSLGDSCKDSDFKIQTVYLCGLQEVLSKLLKVKVSNSNTSFLIFRNVKPFRMIQLLSNISHQTSEIKQPFQESAFYEITSQWNYKGDINENIGSLLEKWLHCFLISFVSLLTTYFLIQVESPLHSIYHTFVCIFQVPPNQVE